VQHYSSLPELQQYFKDLELLFILALIVSDIEKKIQASCYVDIDTVDLWESIPEYKATQTYGEFKAVIFKLYPGSEAEHRWIVDMDKLVAEQLQTRILDVAAPGNYYCMFYTVTSFLLMGNHISKAEKSRAFVRGLQPALWYCISQHLEIKFPDHDLDDPYPISNVFDTPKYLLHGTVNLTAIRATLLTQGEQFHLSLAKENPK
jgi:hypothetical protein